MAILFFDRRRWLHRSPGLPQVSPRPSPRRQAGFSLLESLIAVTLLTSSIATVALLTTREAATRDEVQSLTQIENAVALDLGWLKTYAKYWRMSSGPYSFLDASMTAASSFTQSPGTLTYEPPMDDDDSSRCLSGTAMASAFLSEAASTGAGTIRPSRPFTVATGKVQLNSSDLPIGVQLFRTITTGNNMVYLSYSLEGTRAARFRYQREVAIRPEAAAWCP